MKKEPLVNNPKGQTRTDGYTPNKGHLNPNNPPKVQPTPSPKK